MFPGTHAQSTPDKAAVVMSSTGESMSFAELHEYAERLANLFQNAGLQEGDHIALCLENRLEFLPICWGAHYAGLYYTAIRSLLTAGEMAYIIEDCGAKAFITSPYKSDEAVELLDLMPAVDLRLSVGGAIDGYDALEDLLPQQPTEPVGPRREGTDMLYSSGTTGRPKGVKVPLPDADLGEADGVTGLLALLFGATEDSVYLSPAPLYHAAPLRFCRGINRIGGTVVVMERNLSEIAIRRRKRFMRIFGLVGFIWAMIVIDLAQFGHGEDALVPMMVMMWTGMGLGIGHFGPRRGHRRLVEAAKERLQWTTRRLEAVLEGPKIAT